MIIALGNKVIGREGPLGEIKRFIIDRKSKRAEQMTVKHGLGGEKLITVFDVQRVEDGKIYVNLDKKAFDRADEFSELAYRAPGMDLDTIPETPIDTGFRAPNMVSQYGELESLVQPEPPSKSPGRQSITPEDQREASVSHETVIYDKVGEPVGHVGQFAVEAETGLPVRLALQTGVVFHGNEEIPLEMVSDYGSERITVSIGKEQLHS